MGTPAATRTTPSSDASEDVRDAALDPTSDPIADSTDAVDSDVDASNLADADVDRDADADNLDAAEPDDVADASDANMDAADVAPGPFVVDAMSFNVRNGVANDGDDRWDLRRDLAVGVVETHGGDFVGLQEAWDFQTDYIVGSVDRYEWIGIPRNGIPATDEATPILYDAARWELDGDQTGTFWLSPTPDEVGSVGWDAALPRICTWGRFVERSTGRAVYVYNTHFDHRGSEARTNSSALIVEHIGDRATDDPVIVLGDLNAGPSSSPLTTLTSDPGYLVDTFAVAVPGASGDGTFHGFNGGTGGSRIDFVLASPDAQVLDAAILYDNTDGRYPSDHYPVQATVEFP